MPLIRIRLFRSFNVFMFLLIFGNACFRLVYECSEEVISGCCSAMEEKVEGFGELSMGVSPGVLRTSLV